MRVMITDTWEEKHPFEDIHNVKAVEVEQDALGFHRLVLRFAEGPPKHFPMRGREALIVE